jgi:O-antigen ligase
MFLLGFILFWIGGSVLSGDSTLISFLSILVVLPFNITLQLPQVVKIFETEIVLSYPYINGLYSSYLVPTISILDIAIVLFLLSLLLEKGREFSKSMSKPVRTGLIVFCLSLLIQNLLLVDFLSILNSIRLLLSVFFILGAIFFLKNYLKERNTVWVYRIFLLNILLQGVLGIVQFRNGTSLGLRFLGESQVVGGMLNSSFVELNDQIFLRAYGTFPHPNILGGFFLLTAVLSIFVIKKNKVLGVLLLFSSFLFSLFTFSRVAIVLIGLVLVVSLIKPPVSIKNNFFSFTPLLLVERFKNILSLKENSWKDRLNLLKVGLNVVKESWILGTGLGNFVRALGDSIPRTSKGILLAQPVHNIFLLAFAELGILGFLALFYTIIKVVLENIGRMNWIKWCILFSLLIIGSVDHYLFTLPQGLTIFCLLILLLTLDLETLYKDK